MKGLERIPGNQELQHAYASLQARRGEAAVHELALWSQWSRMDPRLAEQVVEHIGARWKELLPAALNQELRKQPWPSAMGVILAQCGALWIARPEKRAFGAWSDCVMAGVARADFEQFFIGLSAFAGKSMHEDARLAIKPYRAWGYLGRDLLINKAASRPGKTLLPVDVRLSVLRELLSTSTRITVSDYIQATEGTVSRRQAELDLQNCGFAAAIGSTRSRYYRLRRR